MNHPIPHPMPSSDTDGGQCTERGPDGQLQVLISIDGRLRRVPFADFVEAERRHALALRRAAIDRAFKATVAGLRRHARRLRRQVAVTIGRGLRTAPARSAPVKLAA